MKKFSSFYLLLIAFGISAICNILYITNTINETWFRLGFAFVMTVSATINILSFFRKKKNTPQEKSEINNTHYISLALAVILGLSWIITYFIAIFR